MVLSGRIICSKPGIYADGVQFCIFVFKKIQYIMKHLVAILFMLAAMPSLLFSQDFKLGESGYFNCKGVDAMLFNDYYPEGHQGGVSIIMHGKRDVSAATGLAAVSRVLKGHNDTLSYHCLEIARKVFSETEEASYDKINLAIELYRTTGGQAYFDYVIANWDAVVRNISHSAPKTAAFAKALEGNRKYRKQYAAYRAALLSYRDELEMQTSQTPYGVPYKPDIWGAGWAIQSFGFNHYFLVDAFPDIFSPEPVINAMNFVLGCHPGSNRQSFASGVGSESATVGYGLNRADWSYVPGGVVSGTALIRPDFPELLVWPYLWQQVEYVLGGGSSHYMFLILASRDLLQQRNN